MNETAQRYSRCFDICLSWLASLKSLTSCDAKWLISHWRKAACKSVNASSLFSCCTNHFWRTVWAVELISLWLLVRAVWITLRDNLSPVTPSVNKSSSVVISLDKLHKWESVNVPTVVNYNIFNFNEIRFIELISKETWWYALLGFGSNYNWIENWCKSI